MTDMMTTTGLIATELRHVVTREGLAITSFRLAAGQRKYNRSKQTWEYGETNWYTVSAFRQLATNLAGSLAKGDRVLVTGRMHIRAWENAERSGTVIEIDADSVGHDLNWGTAHFTRSIASIALAAGDRVGDNDEPTDTGEPQEAREPAGPAFDPDERMAGIGAGCSGAAGGAGGWATAELSPLVPV